MNLVYKDHDITDYVNITKCVCRNVSCGRADSMELEFDHAASWYAWGPKEDDTIIGSMDGFTTGKMFLNAVMPEGDKFRIIATALPSASKRKAWDTYVDMTLGSIMQRCAAEIGMDGKLYGIDGNIRYPYLTRNYEGCAAFLDRLGRWEGLAVKAVNGAMRGVSVEYAQGLDAVQNLWIDTKQDGVTYTRQENKKISALTLLSPHARVVASDSNAAYGSSLTISGLPVTDPVQAGRWARGILLMHNRQQERLTIRMEFNPSMRAMMRVDIDGTTDASGAWIVDEVEHDLVNRTSEIKLVRAITTIR